MVLKDFESFGFIELKQDSQSGLLAPSGKLSDPKTYDEVKDFPDVGMLIPEPYVVLDFDSMDDWEIIKEILVKENLESVIMTSKRGGHVWFKSEKPLTNHIGINTPITLNIDIRSWGKLSYVKVKTKGVWRDFKKINVDKLEDIQYIPDWIKPLKHNFDLSNMRSGSGRNDALFRYIIPLTQVGLSKEQIQNLFGLINKYVFNEPLSQSELSVILRDEAFDNLRPAFFNGKQFQHHIFAEYMKRNDDIYVENGRLYVYQDGYYSDDYSQIEGRMIEYIPSLLATQRREVLSYLKLIADELGDPNQYVINCLNGTLDVRTLTLVDDNPMYNIKNKLNTTFDKSAYDENVDKVLDKISCNDKELRNLIEEMMGYILLPSVRYHKAFILKGEGSNGKSTLLEMIGNMVGDKNISSLSMQELNHNFKLAEITNKVANIGDDISDKYMDDSSIFKKLVSGEEITVDKKNETPYKIRNYATLLFAMNDLPQVRDKSYGFNRRLIIIPFDAEFKSTDPDFDPFILDKLKSDNAKSYLLNVALSGLTRLFNQNGFTEPRSVDSMLSEYMKDNNNVLQFIENYDPEGVPSKDVYKEYQFWCSDNGLESYGIRKFNKEIRRVKNLELQVENVGGKSQQVWRTI